MDSIKKCDEEGSDMKWRIKKRNNSRFPYSVCIGKFEWGLKRHVMNLSYMYAVPMNAKAKKRETNPLKGLWFYMKDGKMHQTRTPAVWVEN